MLRFTRLYLKTFAVFIAMIITIDFLNFEAFSHPDMTDARRASSNPEMASELPISIMRRNFLDQHSPENVRQEICEKPERHSGKVQKGDVSI